MWKLIATGYIVLVTPRAYFEYRALYPVLSRWLVCRGTVHATWMTISDIWAGRVGPHGP